MMDFREQYSLLYDRIKDEKNVIITTHRTPDADGLGAELALYDLFKNRGADVHILNQEKVPEKIRFLDINRNTSSISESTGIPEVNGQTVICVDNSEIDRIGDVSKYLREDRSNLIIIDHHDNAQADYKNLFQFPGISSSSEIIFEIYNISGLQIPVNIAMALYTGIIMDTGNFRYRKTRPRTHEIAAHLLEAGVRPDFINDQIQFHGPLARLRMKQQLYNRLELDATESVAWFQISWKDLEKLELTFDDLEGIVNELIEPTQIKVGALFTERNPGLTKVSVRSKGDTDLLPAVEPFGGGGHKNACGASIKKEMSAAIEEFIPHLLRTLNIQP